MKKGKFGLPLSIPAVIAFVFAAINQPIALLLIAGFAILGEKDEWLNKQVIEATLLCAVYNLILLLLNIFFNAFNKIFDWADAEDAIYIFNDLHSLINYLVLIGLIAISVIAIIKLLCGKDANLPLLSKIASGKSGKAKEAVSNETEPVKPKVEIVEPTKEETKRFCPNCGTELIEGSKFCKNCGKKLD